MKMTTDQQAFLNYLETENPCKLVRQLTTLDDHSAHVLQAISKTLIKLNNWRMQHRKAIMRYSHDRPERNPMTAGGGQMTYEKYGTKIETANDMICFFTGRLQDRIVETRSTTDTLAQQCPASAQRPADGLQLRRRSTSRSISPSPSRFRASTSASSSPVLNKRQTFAFSKLRSTSLSSGDVSLMLSTSDCLDSLPDSQQVPESASQIPQLPFVHSPMRLTGIEPDPHSQSTITNSKCFIILLITFLLGLMFGKYIWVW